MQPAGCVEEESVTWGALIDDGAARLEATRRAALAYRALVGPAPEVLGPEAIEDPDPAGPLIALLTRWAGGVREGVDEGRARRLFWVHFLGPALFAELFPGAPPLSVWDGPVGVAGAGESGSWRLCRPGPRAASAVAPARLCSPWPREVTLLILLDVLGAPAWQPLQTGGRVLCAEAPFGT